MPGQSLFEVFVFASGGRVIAKIVSKGQRPPFRRPAALDNVNVVTVRPMSWPVKEGTRRVVGIRHTDVPDGLKPIAVRRNGLERAGYRRKA